MSSYKESSVYLGLAKKPLSDLTSSDIYSAIQGLTAMDYDDMEEFARWLIMMLELLNLSSDGYPYEGNSGDLLIGVGRIRYYQTNFSEIARLQDIVGDSDVRGGEIPMKNVAIDIELGAGGTLAATQLVAAQAGIAYYAEFLEVKLDPSVSNLAASGGNAAVINIQDDQGTPTVLMKGVVTNNHPCCMGKFGGFSGTNQDLDIQVDAGVAGNVGASKMYGHVNYREVTP